MPFGLCNAPATFQCLMDLVLAELQWSHCLVYLYDMIILGQTMGEHLDNIKATFDWIRSVGLKLGFDKCVYMQKKVKYLGHIVGEDGLQVYIAKVERVASWSTPKSARRYMGFAYYYRIFICGFSEIDNPYTT